MPILLDPTTGLLAPGRHQVLPDDVRAHLVDAFPGSRTRGELFDWWSQMNDTITRFVPIKEQWMGGSYVSAKVDPQDIDVVTHLDAQDVDDLNDVEKRVLLGVLLAGPYAKTLHGCDSYVVVIYPEGSPFREDYLSSHDYWQNLFGHTREMSPRGFLQVGVDG